MFCWTFSFALAQAPVAAPPVGELWIDARVPLEARVDGVPIAQLFVPGQLIVPVPVGDHQLTALIAGAPQQVQVHIPPPGERAVVLAGRSGLTTELRPAPRLAAAGEVPVSLRVTGGASLQVRIDAQRLLVEPGAGLTLALPAGPHPMSVRSREGTVIWASGTLHLAGDQTVVVQLGEGRLPETSGAGSSFAAGD
jgi:hypothetical protein